MEGHVDGVVAEAKFIQSPPNIARIRKGHDVTWREELRITNTPPTHTDTMQ